VAEQQWYETDEVRTKVLKVLANDAYDMLGEKATDLLYKDDDFRQMIRDEMNRRFPGQEVLIDEWYDAATRAAVNTDYIDDNYVEISSEAEAIVLRSWLIKRYGEQGVIIPKALTSGQQWSYAKEGWKLISNWIKDQHGIDGDFVQVQEILAEWWRDLIQEIKSANPS